jgi:D-amino-acid dehydrogenase
MAHVIVIGAGITGITTAYGLLEDGHKVTLIERQHYPAMETSYANGGQLSASNAEVWNNWSTILKGLKWMLRPDAPLLVNPMPTLHKYAWFAEFCLNMRHHRKNTVATTRLAIAARDRMFDIAARENIEFDLERRGILHIYHDKQAFTSAERGNQLLKEGGLDRYAVTPDEMRSIEPTLTGEYYGGFFTPSDSTGDIHKFTRGLAEACVRRGATLRLTTAVTEIGSAADGPVVTLAHAETQAPLGTQSADAVILCAGVGSRALAATVGDRVNIYPVKGYSITVNLPDDGSRGAAPTVSLLDDAAKIVTSRLGLDRFRVAGTAEFNGFNRDIRADRIAPLIRWVRRLFPGVNTSSVVQWAGLRPMTPNMMPRVGRGTRPGVYYNTGHGHLGWTLSAATATMLVAMLREDLSPVSVAGIKPLEVRAGG